jgi:hypothetical protein
VVTAELVAARRAAIDASADLSALRVRLAERAAPVLARVPVIPEAKALLSRDGGVCPVDGAALVFDPWSPQAHRCPRCGAVQRGERHHRWWARFQHLWLAERAAHLAALAALADHAAAAHRAVDLLAAYGARYFAYPNQDNVLGPSRLFFSTYLESLWLSNYLAAAMLLRAAGRLDDGTGKVVSQVAEEAANLIGEFDERHSNRQTWNDSALAAVAAWFGDNDLMRESVQGRSGLASHLMEGFRPDGMWYEGENYHLFALRGVLTGLSWARVAGVDVTGSAPLAERLAAALLAPARTALPDGTFPARKDSRFGVSLAQPMYLETWEVGVAMLGSGEQGAGSREQVAAWLRALYALPSPAAETFDSYLHEADCSPLPAPRYRHDLSWWSLLDMLPELPAAAEAWASGPVLLPDQGLAVLRDGSRYVSLDCGPYAGGHGHRDRLHLTVHDGAVLWLPDPGTGSYVSPDLFWYRSTLAHNAPRLDGVDQGASSADCLAFDAHDGWSWAVGRFGDVSRTVVTGPAYVMDLVELTGSDERLLEVPWHFAGAVDLTAPGRWMPGELAADGVDRVEEFEPSETDAPLVARATVSGRALGVHLLGASRLVRADAPGVPGTGRATFLVARVRARNTRLLTVLVPEPADAVRAVRWSGDQIEIETAAGVDQHRIAAGAWTVATAAGRVALAGTRKPRAAFTPFLVLEPHDPARGQALGIDAEPPLDGTLGGFDTSEPLTLELEDQYRRSEEPYAGPEDFAATAWVNWTREALYVAVEVRKGGVWFRPADAPPLLLDNEPDDIHSDGLQVYLGEGEGRGHTGYLVVPAGDGSVRARAAGGDGAAGAVRGRWRAIPEGYRVTLRLAWPAWARPHAGGEIGFDVLVNEMYETRVRRAGQLVWSGGNGWVYLRGDRQDPDRLGVLELIG